MPPPTIPQDARDHAGGGIGKAAEGGSGGVQLARGSPRRAKVSTGRAQTQAVSSTASAPPVVVHVPLPNLTHPSWPTWTSHQIMSTCDMSVADEPFQEGERI